MEEERKLKNGNEPHILTKEDRVAGGQKRSIAKDLGYEKRKIKTKNPELYAIISKFNIDKPVEALKFFRDEIAELKLTIDNVDDSDFETKFKLQNLFLMRVGDLMKFIASEKSIIQQNVSMEIKSTSDEVMRRLKEAVEEEEEENKLKEEAEKTGDDSKLKTFQQEIINRGIKNKNERFGGN